MKRIFSIGFLFVLLLSACAPVTSAPTEPPATPTEILPTIFPADPEPTIPANPTLILATTTSTQDSGLLDVLIPLFEEQTGFTVQTIAVGSGEAMKMGEEGNADVLLVHAPSSEVAFMEVGKSLGTDLARQKMTLPLFHFFRAGPAPMVAKVRETLASGRGAESAPWIRAAVHAAGSVEFARRAAEDYVTSAARSLDVLPESPARETLRRVAGYVLERRR